MPATAEPPRAVPSVRRRVPRARAFDRHLNHAKRTRRRETIEKTECSWRWATDIWLGHDRDYQGNYTGSGTGKIRCAGTLKQPCGRLVPPQDVANAVRLPADFVGPPPAPLWRCSDCRMIAREPRGPSEDVTIIRGMRLVRVGRWHDGAEHVAEPFTEVVDDGDSLPDDSSPMTAALAALEDMDGALAESALPFEDTADLQEAIAVYSATGDLVDFARASGDLVAADDQRHRYHASRQLRV